MSTRPFAIRREHHYGDRTVTCFADRPASIDALFRAAVQRAPERCALVWGEQRITYRELDWKVEALSANLTRRGLRTGDRLRCLSATGRSFCSRCSLRCGPAS